MATFLFPVMTQDFSCLIPDFSQECLQLSDVVSPWDLYTF
jgi:hypothetical protein